MRVLEIGRGIASTTTALLQALDKDGDLSLISYEYTAKTSESLEQAQSVLQIWSKAISFGTLNTEKDLATQGFGETKYDLVITVNDLHTIANPDAALERIHGLLIPGGSRAVIEPTHNTAALNMMCGNFAGWWKGTTSFLPQIGVLNCC